VTDEPAKDAEPPSRFGRFLQKYATLLSSTVLGIAGLAATSIWQFRQAATAQQQAASQQRVAEAAATNSWKIERADILSKNIGTLAGNGSDTVEQRYGVLLSLTRGNLIDPELAVSYALELGKDNPDDMVSVMSNVTPKDYSRLARAFTLSCDERYGTTPAIDDCNDKLAGRSAAIAQLFSDEGEAELGSAAVALIANAPPAGPLSLLKDERQVQIGVQRLTALFEPLLTSLYEGRKWDAIDRFLADSTGAHLVGSLALSAAHTGEFVTDDEAKQLKQFHDAQSKWLVGYLIGTTCDPECKSRTLDVMVSHYAESQGSFDTAVRQLLESPRAQSAMAVTFLHARLLWCQVDDSDLIPLRDNVLVPAATTIVGNPKADAGVRDALLSLVALVTEPAEADAGRPAWQALLTAADKAGEKLSRTLRDRHATAEQQRQNPPAAFKKRDFCLAPHASDPSSDVSVPAPAPTAPARFAPRR
jgi:hypothetical protein